MQITPGYGPPRPRETLPLFVTPHADEVRNQLQDATVSWTSAGYLDVELRGEHPNVEVFVTPLRQQSGYSIIVQARLTHDRLVALSLNMRLEAVLEIDEPQESLVGEKEAHAITLSGFNFDRTYLLQVNNPPRVPRGSVETKPTDDQNDLSDSFFGVDSKSLLEEFEEDLVLEEVA